MSDIQSPVSLIDGELYRGITIPSAFSPEQKNDYRERIDYAHTMSSLRNIPVGEAFQTALKPESDVFFAVQPIDRRSWWNIVSDAFKRSELDNDVGSQLQPLFQSMRADPFGGDPREIDRIIEEGIKKREAFEPGGYQSWAQKQGELIGGTANYMLYTSLNGGIGYMLLALGFTGAVALTGGAAAGVPAIVAAGGLSTAKGAAVAGSLGLALGSALSSKERTTHAAITQLSLETYEQLPEDRTDYALYSNAILNTANRIGEISAAIEALPIDGLQNVIGRIAPRAAILNKKQVTSALLKSIDGIISSGASKYVVRTAQGAIGEGIEEGLQELTYELLRNTFTTVIEEAGVHLDPHSSAEIMDNVIESFIAGVTLGAPLSAVSNVAAVRSEQSEKDTAQRYRDGIVDVARDLHSEKINVNSKELIDVTQAISDESESSVEEYSDTIVLSESTQEAIDRVLEITNMFAEQNREVHATEDTTSTDVAREQEKQKFGGLPFIGTEEELPGQRIRSFADFEKVAVTNFAATEEEAQLVIGQLRAFHASLSLEGFQVSEAEFFDAIDIVSDFEEGEQPYSARIERYVRNTAEQGKIGIEGKHIVHVLKATRAATPIALIEEIGHVVADYVRQNKRDYDAVRDLGIDVATEQGQEEFANRFRESALKNFQDIGQKHSVVKRVFMKFARMLRKMIDTINAFRGEGNEGGAFQYFGAAQSKNNKLVLPKNDAVITYIDTMILKRDRTTADVMKMLMEEGVVEQGGADIAEDLGLLPGISPARNYNSMEAARIWKGLSVNMQNFAKDVSGQQNEGLLTDNQIMTFMAMASVINKPSQSKIYYHIIERGRTLNEKVAAAIFSQIYHKTNIQQQIQRKRIAHPPKSWQALFQDNSIFVQRKDETSTSFKERKEKGIEQLAELFVRSAGILLNNIEQKAARTLVQIENNIDTIDVDSLISQIKDAIIHLPSTGKIDAFFKGPIKEGSEHKARMIQAVNTYFTQTKRIYGRMFERSSATISDEISTWASKTAEDIVKWLVPAPTLDSKELVDLQSRLIRDLDSLSEEHAIVQAENNPLLYKRRYEEDDVIKRVIGNVPQAQLRKLFTTADNMLSKKGADALSEESVKSVDSNATIEEGSTQLYDDNAEGKTAQVVLGIRAQDITNKFPNIKFDDEVLTLAKKIVIDSYSDESVGVIPTISKKTAILEVADAIEDVLGGNETYDYVAIDDDSDVTPYSNSVNPEWFMNKLRDINDYKGVNDADLQVLALNGMGLKVEKRRLERETYKAMQYIVERAIVDNGLENRKDFINFAIANEIAPDRQVAERMYDQHVNRNLDKGDTQFIHSLRSVPGMALNVAHILNTHIARTGKALDSPRGAMVGSIVNFTKRDGNTQTNKKRFIDSLIELRDRGDKYANPNVITDVRRVVAQVKNDRDSLLEIEMQTLNSRREHAEVFNMKAPLDKARKTNATYHNIISRDLSAKLEGAIDKVIYLSDAQRAYLKKQVKQNIMISSGRVTLATKNLGAEFTALLKEIYRQVNRRDKILERYRKEDARKLKLELNKLFTDRTVAGKIPIEYADIVANLFRGRHTNGFEDLLFLPESHSIMEKMREAYDTLERKEGYPAPSKAINEADLDPDELEVFATQVNEVVKKGRALERQRREAEKFEIDTIVQKSVEQAKDKITRDRNKYVHVQQAARTGTNKIQRAASSLSAGIVNLYRADNELKAYFGIELGIQEHLGNATTRQYQVLHTFQQRMINDLTENIGDDYEKFLRKRVRFRLPYSKKKLTINIDQAVGHILALNDFDARHALLWGNYADVGNWAIENRDVVAKWLRENDRDSDARIIEGIPLNYEADQYSYSIDQLPDYIVDSWSEQEAMVHLSKRALSDYVEFVIRDNIVSKIQGDPKVQSYIDTYYNLMNDKEAWKALAYVYGRKKDMPLGRIKNRFPMVAVDKSAISSQDTETIFLTDYFMHSPDSADFGHLMKRTGGSQPIILSTHDIMDRTIRSNARIIGLELPIQQMLDVVEGVKRSDISAFMYRQGLRAIDVRKHLDNIVTGLRVAANPMRAWDSIPYIMRKVKRHLTHAGLAYNPMTALRSFFSFVLYPENPVTMALNAARVIGMKAEQKQALDDMYPALAERSQTYQTLGQVGEYGEAGARAGRRGGHSKNVYWVAAVTEMIDRAYVLTAHDRVMKQVGNDPVKIEKAVQDLNVVIQQSFANLQPITSPENKPALFLKPKAQTLAYMFNLFNSQGWNVQGMLYSDIPTHFKEKQYGLAMKKLTQVMVSQLIFNFIGSGVINALVHDNDEEAAAKGARDALISTALSMIIGIGPVIGARAAFAFSQFDKTGYIDVPQFGLIQGTAKTFADMATVIAKVADGQEFDTEFALGQAMPALTQMISMFKMVPASAVRRIAKFSRCIANDRNIAECFMKALGRGDIS